jgi:hypothetical protein
MPSSLKYLIAACILSVLIVGAPSSDAQPSGIMEGHLRIVSLKEVELADETPSKGTAENDVGYPLIILSRDGKKEITRINADGSGNYRAALPPGAYVLDVQGRARGHLRATPQPFKVAAGETVRVDMDIDTGVR